jgi:hypothetical protein
MWCPPVTVAFHFANLNPGEVRNIRMLLGQNLPQEALMSGLNGDKSRFHRERKQKIAKRKRNRELFKAAVGSAKPSAPPVRSKPE